MCQNAQDPISLDLHWCWQCKTGTPFFPMGGHIPMTHCTTQGCCNAHSDATGHNNTHQHTEPLVLMDIASAAPNAQEAKWHNTWNNKICLKTNPSTQAMCMFPQQLLCQMLMWLHQGASAYAWWMWPLQAAGENPSQPDQTVRSFSCKGCVDISTTM